MKVFLTGGTGFIGSYVVQELLGLGHSVTILARNVNKVPAFQENPKIKLVQGLLTENDTIASAMEGADACVHIALGWGDTGVEMLAADTAPSAFIFETAAKVGVRKIIYTSSIAAVGDQRPVMTEEIQPRPTDFYGATKSATEAYLLAAARRYDVLGNVIRPGYTFGNPVIEGAFIQTDQRFPNIIRAAKAGTPIIVGKNDGTQFIWAGDLAKIYSSVIASEHTRKIYTGVGTEWISWEQIARYAVELLGSNSEIVLEDRTIPEKPGVYDVSAIENDFGLSFTSFEQIKDHVEYHASVLEGESA